MNAFTRPIIVDVGVSGGEAMEFIALAGTRRSVREARS